ncbi:MAG: hypothetical protein ACLFVH_13165, partial [Phycisphaerae bacterium]
SLLAGSVQAKSYNMIGWWRENRTASPPILFAGAAVDGDTTKSNLFINAFPTTVGAASDPDWTHETTYGVIAGGVDIITDTETITFFSNGPGMNLSNPLGGNAPDYHPGEFLFTMDIVQSGGGSLTGTVTATWSNDEDSLQTYDPETYDPETYDPEALVYGVGPGVDITQPGNWPAGNHGLNVVVDIPGIPEDAIIPEPVTMLAAGAGLMGLGGYIRRRRRG